jgi:hypothetical protein
MHIYKLLFIRCNGNNRGRKSRSGYMQVHLQEVQELNAGLLEDISDFAQVMGGIIRREDWKRG